jgi:hypothetical protein
MKNLKQIRWTVAITLLAGLALGLGSGWLEGLSLSTREGSFAVYFGGMAGKLFTLAVLVIGICGLELQRAKTVARLEKLEDELSLLKKSAA